MSRNWPALDLSPSGQTWDNMRMEQMIDRLREIGVSQESIDALRGEDENDVREYALLLIAMFDDRHEFMA